MKKLSAILLAALLTGAACTTPEEPQSQGIEVLDEDQSDDGGSGRPNGDDGGDKAPAKGAGGKAKAPAKGSGGGGSQPAAGGGSDDSTGDGDGGGGGGGGGSQAQPAPVPVPQGEYAYATRGSRTISGNTDSLPRTTTLRAGGPAGGVQRQARDLRDSDGNGTLTETDLVYRSDGVFLSYVKVTSRFQGGITDVREFDLPQPQLLAPRGGGPRFERSFTMEGSGTRAKVTVTAHRWETVEVAGEEVLALLAVTDIRFSGALEGYQRSTTWFWPKHLLPLKEQVQTDVRNGPIRLQGNYQAQIERLP